MNDPPRDVNRSDCNLRLVCPKMERKIEYLIAECGFRLVKRNFNATIDSVAEDMRLLFGWLLIHS